MLQSSMYSDLQGGHFTLMGEAILNGEIAYDEMFDSIVFILYEGYFDAPIIIEGSFMDYEYNPNIFYFNNEDAVLNTLSDNEINEIMSGTPKNGKISVKDFEANINLGSEGATTCFYNSLIDGWY